MEKALSALLGIVVGFLLPTIASLIKAKTVGRRFVNALEQELEEAKEKVHQKMRWLSRDVKDQKGTLEARLLVESDGRLLYLGEPETFDAALSLWQENIRDIVEIVDTRSFDRLCSQVSMLRAFAAKFKDMKAAFSCPEGDPQKMALVCYQELTALQEKLMPARLMKS